MRRQDILDAAERVIEKEGWENTDFGKVAKRARLSRSLVYVYFPTRDDLFHAVCGRGLSDLERRFATVMATKAPGLEQVMKLGQAYYAFAREQPLYFSMIAQFNGREVDPDDQSSDEQVARHCGMACLGRLIEALEHGLADGSIRKSLGDVRVAALAVWSFAHGLIQIAAAQQNLLRQDFKIEAAQMIEQGLKLLNDSLAAGRR